MNIDVLKEEKDKNIFLDCLNQAISFDLTKLVFARKLLSQEFPIYTHPQFRLILMIKGDYTYKILNENDFIKSRLAPGNALFCQHNGVSGNVAYLNNGTYKMFTIVFWPHLTRFLVSDHAAKVDKTEHMWYHSHNAVNQAGIYVLKALDELVDVPDSNIQACLLAKTLLSICHSHLKNDSSQATTKSFRTYQNIMIYLYENAYKKINRNSTAEAFQITPSHISKLFATYNKHNFNTELKILRIEHAEELLKYTTLLIAEIAEQCGFINTEYFIKTFRLFHGETPGVFRRNTTQNNIQ